MKAKLIKTEKGFGLVSADKTQAIASTINPNDSLKLSLKNCQTIENGYDLDELAEQNWRIGLEEYIPTPVSHVTSFKAGFQKALEILGDKKFSEEDMRKAIGISKNGSMQEQHNGYGGSAIPRFVLDNLPSDEIIQSLQQTEWDVSFNPDEKDSDGCLILKRK